MKFALDHRWGGRMRMASVVLLDERHGSGEEMKRTRSLPGRVCVATRAVVTAMLLAMLATTPGARAQCVDNLDGMNLSLTDTWDVTYNTFLSSGTCVLDVTQNSCDVFFSGSSVSASGTCSGFGAVSFTGSVGCNVPSVPAGSQ